MIFLIFLLAIFFAINMGGASFAASYAAAYGGRVLKKWQASFLFLFFVVLGAVLFGQNVSFTLGNNIIDPSIITQRALIVIFLSAGLSMFVSNMMRIPQSTSLVTVAAIAGVGAYAGSVDWATIYYLVPFWIIMPVISYGLTYFIAGFIYPPRRKNFWIYEKFVNQQGNLRKFVIVSSCYSAFSVGTNNVANIGGPLMAGSEFSLLFLLTVFAVVYGSGAFVFTGTLKSAGEKIVPLGLLTASIISLVSGSLMFLASIYGIPQSFVMLQMGAIFAIATLKHGQEITFADPVTRKVLYTWTINPVLTFFVSMGLSFIFLS